MQLRNGKTTGPQQNVEIIQSFPDFIEEFAVICDEFTLRCEKTIHRLIALYEIYDFALSYISNHTQAPEYPMFAELLRTKTNVLIANTAEISRNHGNDKGIRQATLKLFAIMYDTLAFIGPDSI